MKIKKIISGGQTGADQGGLEAGKILKIEIGGTAPPNFMTENGENLHLKHHYGLIEGEPDHAIYPKRTLKNIMDSDGTVIFGDISSRGTRLTLSILKRHSINYIINPHPSELYNWSIENNIKILNVAGNRESKNRGIQLRTRDIIVGAFK